MRDGEDDGRRTTINLLAVIVLLLLMLAGFWLMRELDRARKAHECMATIGRACRQIETR